MTFCMPTPVGRIFRGGRRSGQTADLYKQDSAFPGDVGHVISFFSGSVTGHMAWLQGSHSRCSHEQLPWSCTAHNLYMPVFASAELG